jgi:hypothetical protein
MEHGSNTNNGPINVELRVCICSIRLSQVCFDLIQFVCQWPNPNISRVFMRKLLAFTQELPQR